MYPEAYSLIHQRFNVEHIDELPAAQIPQAIEYVHKLVLEGELLEREKPQQQIGFMPLEIDRDGDWVMKVRDSRPVSYSLIGKGEMVLSKESFQEIMEQAGYLIIHYTELRVMAALDSVRLSDKAEKHHEHWLKIYSTPL
nr:hypothetical protein [Hafnia alvei]